MKNIGLMLILILAGSPLFAGTVVQLETQEAGAAEVEKSEAVIEGQNLAMKIGDEESQDMTMIFRGDRHHLVVVDHDEKSFMVIDKETMAGITGQLQGAMKQIEAQLGNLPPDQAAKLKEMMGGTLPGTKPAEQPKNELRKTSEEADIEGYPCVRYDVFREGEKIRELWVTPWSRVGGKEAFSAFSAFGELANELMTPLQGMASMSAGNSFLGADNPFEDWNDLAGLPMLVKMLEDGEVVHEARIKSISERKVDPSELEPNPGYTERQMPGHQ